MKQAPISYVTIAIFWAGAIALGFLGVLGPIFTACVLLVEVAIASYALWFVGMWIIFAVRAMLRIPDPKIDRSLQSYGCVCIVVLALTLLARRYL